MTARHNREIKLPIYTNYTATYRLAATYQQHKQIKFNLRPPHPLRPEAQQLGHVCNNRKRILVARTVSGCIKDRLDTRDLHRHEAARRAAGLLALVARVHPEPAAAAHAAALLEKVLRLVVRAHRGGRTRALALTKSNHERVSPQAHFPPETAATRPRRPLRHAQPLNGQTCQAPANLESAQSWIDELE